MQEDMVPDGCESLRRKEQVRAAVLADRRRQENKEELSRQICEKLARLPEYTAAQTVMTYVGLPAEVQTRPSCR